MTLNNIETVEDRLHHFLQWMDQRGVNMSWDPHQRVTLRDRKELVEEYVNE